jgi:hypothetical protein
MNEMATAGFAAGQAASGVDGQDYNLLVLMDRKHSQVESEDYLDGIVEDCNGVEVDPSEATSHHGCLFKLLGPQKWWIVSCNPGGEMDMDNPMHLAKFVNKGVTDFKGAKNMLSLWNHGGSWRYGFGGDDSLPGSSGRRLAAKVASGPLRKHLRDRVTRKGRRTSTNSKPAFVQRMEHWNKAMKPRASKPSRQLSGGMTLSQNGQNGILQGVMAGLYGTCPGCVPVASGFKFDVFGFDTCLLSDYTALQALGGLADYYVASQEVEPGHGWNYEGLLPYNEDGIVSSPVEYAKSIVDYFYHHSSQTPRTLALWETSKFHVFDVKMNKLWEGLQNPDGPFLNAWNEAKNEATPNLSYGQQVDMGSLLLKLKNKLAELPSTEDCGEHPKKADVEEAYDAYLAARVHHIDDGCPAPEDGGCSPEYDEIRSGMLTWVGGVAILPGPPQSINPFGVDAYINLMGHTEHSAAMSAAQVLTGLSTMPTCNDPFNEPPAVVPTFPPTTVEPTEQHETEVALHANCAATFLQSAMYQPQDEAIEWVCTNAPNNNKCWTNIGNSCTADCAAAMDNYLDFIGEPPCPLTTTAEATTAEVTTAEATTAEATTAEATTAEATTNAPSCLSPEQHSAHMALMAPATQCFLNPNPDELYPEPQQSLQSFPADMSKMCDYDHQCGQELMNFLYGGEYSTCEFESNELEWAWDIEYLCYNALYYSDNDNFEVYDDSGEAVCEYHGFGQVECEGVGCCHWDGGDCFSAVGSLSCSSSLIPASAGSGSGSGIDSYYNYEPSQEELEELETACGQENVDNAVNTQSLQSLCEIIHEIDDPACAELMGDTCFYYAYYSGEWEDYYDDQFDQFDEFGEWDSFSQACMDAGCPSYVLENEWLGDNYCDAACNIPECEFDMGDCCCHSGSTACSCNQYGEEICDAGYEGLGCTVVTEIAVNCPAAQATLAVGQAGNIEKHASGALTMTGATGPCMVGVQGHVGYKYKMGDSTTWMSASMEGNLHAVDESGSPVQAAGDATEKLASAHWEGYIAYFQQPHMGAKDIRPAPANVQVGHFAEIMRHEVLLSQDPDGPPEFLQMEVPVEIWPMDVFQMQLCPLPDSSMSGSGSDPSSSDCCVTNSVSHACSTDPMKDCDGEECYHQSMEGALVVKLPLLDGDTTIFEWSLYMDYGEGEWQEVEKSSMETWVLRPLWAYVQDPEMGPTGAYGLPEIKMMPACVGGYHNCKYFVWGDPQNEMVGELDIGFWHISSFKDGGSWFEEVIFGLEIVDGEDEMAELQLQVEQVSGGEPPAPEVSAAPLCPAGVFFITV